MPNVIYYAIFLNLITQKCVLTRFIADKTITSSQQSPSIPFQNEVKNQSYKLILKWNKFKYLRPLSQQNKKLALANIYPYLGLFLLTENHFFHQQKDPTWSKKYCKHNKIFSMTPANSANQLTIKHQNCDNNGHIRQILVILNRSCRWFLIINDWKQKWSIFLKHRMFIYFSKFLNPNRPFLRISLGNNNWSHHSSDDQEISWN